MDSRSATLQRRRVIVSSAQLSIVSRKDTPHILYNKFECNLPVSTIFHFDAVTFSWMATLQMRTEVIFPWPIFLLPACRTRAEGAYEWLVTIGCVPVLAGPAMPFKVVLGTKSLARIFTLGIWALVWFLVIAVVMFSAT